MPNPEKKKLPINLQQQHIVSLTTALPLCVLLSDEQHLGWFYENYIKLFTHLDYPNSFECKLLDELNYGVGAFWDTRLIRYSYMPKYVMEQVSDIHSVLVNYFNDNMYCILFVDEYFIKILNRPKHFAHEILFYGYDDIEQIYYAIAFKDNKFTKILIPYQELADGYKYVFACIDDRPGWSKRMFLQLRKVPHKTPYSFSIKIFITNLTQYLNSNYTDKEKYLSLFYERELNIPHRKIQQGLAVEIDFIQYLTLLITDIESKNKNTLNRYDPFQVLATHKVFIFDRLKYAQKNYTNSRIDTLVFEYENIVTMSHQIKLSFLKYRCYFENDKYSLAVVALEKTIDMTKKMFSNEKEVLTSLIEEFNKIL